ncbi:MAG: hypothetical protein ACR2P8_14955 [Myxococcota bacterium]
MRKITTGIVLLALVALLLPGMAAAQMREFRGKVDKINKRPVIVDNRMGDKLRFKPADDVVVEGEKDAYKRVKKNDWVIVSWKMVDNPRVAYKIVVLPDQEEAGADE